MVHGRLHIYEDCQQAPPSTSSFPPLVIGDEDGDHHGEAGGMAGGKSIINHELGVKIHYSCMCVFLPAGQIQHHRHFVAMNVVLPVNIISVPVHL